MDNIHRFTIAVLKDKVAYHNLRLERPGSCSIARDLDNLNVGFLFSTGSTGRPYELTSSVPLKMSPLLLYNEIGVDLEPS